MKPLRQLCATAVLAFFVTASALAGNIDCGAAPPPPPLDPPALMAGDTATGFTPTSGTTSETSSIDPVTELTLSFLQSVLSLF